MASLFVYHSLISLYIIMPPKKSAVDMSSFHIDDVVLGRLKGYPKWPGRVSSVAHTSVISAE